MAASAAIFAINDDARDTSTITITEFIDALPIELNKLIVRNMSFPDAYQLMHHPQLTEHQRDIVRETLIDDGKRMLEQLEEYWIHPESKYKPNQEPSKCISLESITRQLWNAIICIDKELIPGQETQITELENDVLAYLTMECPPPSSYDDMCDVMWQRIILLSLDTDYDSGMDWLGSYKKLKYIYRAIEKFPTIYGLDTLAKQKYALTILIKTFHSWRYEIMNLYPGEIDIPIIFYRELQCLVARVSLNGDIGTHLIEQQFVKDTFDFIKKQHGYQS